MDSDKDTRVGLYVKVERVTVSALNVYLRDYVKVSRRNNKQIFINDAIMEKIERERRKFVGEK